MLSTRTKLLVVTALVVCVVAITGYRYHRRRIHIHKLPLNELLPLNIPPASCSEWQTQSPPPYDLPLERKCKPLGGTPLCDHLGYPGVGCSGGGSGYCLPPNDPSLAGVLDIGPISGQTRVGQPITVYFRLRDFGHGDAVIYNFGKVDWGDNAQDQLLPWNPNGVTMTHIYRSEKTFVINAMAGAQFKYSTPQVGGMSGSYEGCQDNSIQVTITP